MSDRIGAATCDHQPLVAIRSLRLVVSSSGPLGWTRVSHCELDLQRSTPENPWHAHRREEPLKPGETMPVEIEIWPSGTRFRASEQLRLLIHGRPRPAVPAGSGPDGPRLDPQRGRPRHSRRQSVGHLHTRAG